jgi:HD-GYP domain-containing protein (c-di-GMP phosphodiesterase class II)
MSDQTWVIQTEDLQIGTVLGFDLLDANGNVLHQARMPVTERLKSRLAANGITSVTIRGASETSPSRVESVLLEAFDPATIHALRKSIDSAEQSVSNAVARICQGMPIDSEEIGQSAGSFIRIAGKDLAAAFSILTTHQMGTHAEKLQKLADRSAKLSLLGIVMSLTQGQSEEFTLEVGMAGLLHDCSLALSPALIARSIYEPIADAELREAYINHPLKSVELLKSSEGIPDRVLEAIAQVHEQADGSGFPRGLRLSQCLYQAVMLNVADAYLSLTDGSASKRFVQSDAVVYLINHAAKGRFCPKTIQLMIKGMSIYPIGTLVLLDDATKAVVVRANTDSPMKPVIRTLDKSQQRIDLTQSTRSIAGPFVDGTTGFERVRKSELDEIFWRLDALPVSPS